MRKLIAWIRFKRVEALMRNMNVNLTFKEYWKELENKRNSPQVSTKVSE